LNDWRVEQPVVRQRRDRALRPAASFNVETTHSIGLSLIIYATGVLDLAIVMFRDHERHLHFILMMEQGARAHEIGRLHRRSPSVPNCSPERYDDAG
jgi:hypothetical protein